MKKPEPRINSYRVNRISENSVERLAYNKERKSQKPKVGVRFIEPAGKIAKITRVGFIRPLHQIRGNNIKHNKLITEN